MGWWPFGKKQPEKPRTEGPRTVAIANLEELPVLKHHALRALVGFLADRHTDCRYPHPFCGLSMPAQVDGAYSLIAEAIPQVDANTGKVSVLAIYLSRAKLREEIYKDVEPPVDPMIYPPILEHVEEAPNRKLIAYALDDGRYAAQFGPIVNPVAGDYSTGRIDQDKIEWLYDCNPEPGHTIWEYFDSTEITEGQETVVRFHCHNDSKTWFITDVDAGRGTATLAAMCDWADNPNHVWNRYKPGDIVVSTH